MTTKQEASEKTAKAAKPPSANLLLLQKLAANKKKRDAAREAEAQQRAAFLESEKRAAEQQNVTNNHDTNLGSRRSKNEDTTFTDLSALQDKLGLGGYSTEYLDTQKILYPAEVEEPTIDVDDNIAAATKEALTSMGIYNPALSAYFQDDDRIMTNEVFRNAVLSGIIATQAIKNKHCSDETAKALFSLVAFSSDGQLAGAAFRTLLCMLGEDTVHTGTDLDAQCGFDTGRKEENGVDLELSVKAVPSAAAILAALVKNGYDPDSKDADKTGEKTEEEGEEGIRTYAIKLLLHTIVAVCNHCARKQEASTVALRPSDVSKLLIAVMYMCLDSAAVRLQPDLDAACIALLGALTEDAWISQLPQLSKNLAAMGKSTSSRLRILRQLPVSNPAVRYRARQLQRFGGCILVEKILPKNLGPKSSAIPARGLLGAPDPTDILLAQPWLRNVKGIITGAKPPVSSAAKKDPSFYTISDVELLLQLCDILLLPSALRMLQERSALYGAGDGSGATPSPVKQKRMGMINEEAEGNEDVEMMDVAQGEKEPILSNEFLTAWTTFLAGFPRYINSLQPEDMAVKTLAGKLLWMYKDVLQNGLRSPGMSPGMSPYGL